MPGGGTPRHETACTRQGRVAGGGMEGGPPRPTAGAPAGAPMFLRRVGEGPETVLCTGCGYNPRFSFIATIAEGDAQIHVVAHARRSWLAADAGATLIQGAGSSVISHFAHT